MSAAGTATLACRVCGTESPLDDTDVVRSAQIAVFVAAHRHPAGLAVALTIAVAADAASPTVKRVPRRRRRITAAGRSL